MRMGGCKMRAGCLRQHSGHNDSAGSEGCSTGDAKWGRRGCEAITESTLPREYASRSGFTCSK
eukprot:6211905-Pleurochrysis_carterae.AAC.2